MDSFKPLLAKVAAGTGLDRAEARRAFDDLLSGEVTPVQAGAFLIALKVRGETADEIVGAVSPRTLRAMR
ncbi:MAG: anthranilate phosphoribosyltransferase, partial [Methylobacterium sp.]